MHTEVRQTIADLTVQAARGSSLFLVDVEIKGDRKNPVIWIYVDSEKGGGVSLDQCAELSREINLLIDAHEVFKSGNYRLNVSSPGLDKPLLDKRQYLNNKGRQSTVHYRAAGGDKTIEGILAEVDDQGIKVETRQGDRESIAFDQIIETRITAVLK